MGEGEGNVTTEDFPEIELESIDDDFPQYSYVGLATVYDDEEPYWPYLLIAAGLAIMFLILVAIVAIIILG